MDLKRFAARYALLLAPLFMASSAGANGVPDGEPVLVGKKYKYESKVLKETRPYLVHLPPSYSTTQHEYPVVILLDGDWHFAHTSATVDHLAGNQRIPEMIVVGISNTDRGRDMTPPLPEGAPRTSSEGSPEGAKNFLSFIADELLPHIDATYRTRPYRVLIGHSFGGLFATYALVTRPEVFKGYLSISPSLWWDEQSLIKATYDFLGKHRDLRADLYVTLGNEGGRMLGGYWKFAAALGETRPPNLRWQFHRWPEETHGSVPLRSTQQGLQALFDGWYIHEPIAVYDKIGLAGIAKNYAEVSTRLGYEVPIPDGLFGWLQSSLNEAKRFDDLETVAAKRLELYPNSADAHLTLGRLHAARQDQAGATEHFSKALTLYPGSAEARAALGKYNVDVATIVPNAETTVATLEEYIGVYRSEVDTGKYTLEGDTLFAASEAGKCELRALAKDRFYCIGADVEVTFNRNRKGRLRSVTVHQPMSEIERIKVN